MADLAIDDADGQLRLLLSGRLDASTVRDPWQRAVRAVKDARTPPVVVDASGVDYCDGAGIALLVDLLRQRAPGEVEVAQPRPRFEALLAAIRSARRSSTTSTRKPPRRPGDRGDRRDARGVGRDMREQVAFIGETAAALVDARAPAADGALARRVATSASASASMRCRSSRSSRSCSA